MKQCKFILVKDWSGKQINIRFGYVFYHRDLMYKSDERDNIDCYGGGKWDIDIPNKTITLYGISDDFGAPNKKDIEKAIQNMDDHAYWQFGWMCERLFEEEYPDESFEVEDMKKYKFILNY